MKAMLLKNAFWVISLFYYVTPNLSFYAYRWCLRSDRILKMHPVPLTKYRNEAEYFLSPLTRALHKHFVALSPVLTSISFSAFPATAPPRSAIILPSSNVVGFSF